MNRQKICIIGGGLTGLLTAMVLSKCNLSIDLFTIDFNKTFTSNRSTAFSHSSYQFLKEQNLINGNFNKIWSILVANMPPKKVT